MQREKQRFVCRNRNCIKKTFQLEYEFNAKYEGTTEKIIDHAMNANGIRDTPLILKISPTTVINTVDLSVNSHGFAFTFYLPFIRRSLINPQYC